MRCTQRRTVFLACLFLLALLLLPGRSAAQLFWNAFDGSDTSVRRIDLDGSNEQALFTGVQSNFQVGGVAVDRRQDLLFWGKTNSGPALERARTNGDQRQAVLVPTGFIRDIELDPGASKVYWAQETEIYRSNYDGTQAEVIAFGLSQATGVTLDTVNDRVYFSDIHLDEIYSANLDGTDRRTVATGGFQAPTGLAIDQVGGKLYWADWASHRIERSDLDGANREVFLDDLNLPSDVVFDAFSRQLYFSDWGDDTISRVDVDTKNLQLFHSGGVSSFTRLALSVPEPTAATLFVVTCLAGFSRSRSR